MDWRVEDIATVVGAIDTPTNLLLQEMEVAEFHASPGGMGTFISQSIDAYMHAHSERESRLSERFFNAL